MTVSVVLCSRNRERQLQHCLSAIPLGELVTLKGEIVLVDSHSTDDTRLIMDEFAAATNNISVRVVGASRAGLALARNLGVASAQYNVIVFLDDDVYLSPGYIHEANALMANAPHQLGLATGRILLHDQTDSVLGCRLRETRLAFPAGSVVRPGQFQGTNLVIRREVWVSIGGFDERLGAGTNFRCEDIDFVARAFQASYTGVYEPRLVVHHHHGRKDGEEAETLKAENSFAAGAFFAKMLKLDYSGYKRLLTLYILSAPVRTNMKLRPFIQGFCEYREPNPED